MPCQSSTKLRWIIHLFIEQRHHGERKLPLRYQGPVNLQLAARVVCVVCRVANMGRRACFRSPPPCSTGLPVLVVRARYPYSSSSLGAALRRPAVIGPAHIVSVSSHATAMQRCKQHANTRLQDVSSRQRLAPTGRLHRRTPSTSSRPPRRPLVARCTAGDHSARARSRVTQGLLFFAELAR